MLPVEPGVNRSIEGSMSRLGRAAGYPQRRAGRRASVGSNRVGDAAHQTFCAEHNSLLLALFWCYFALVLFCFNRARLAGQVAIGFVRRISFELGLPYSARSRFSHMRRIRAT